MYSYSVVGVSSGFASATDFNSAWDYVLLLNPGIDGAVFGWDIDEFNDVLTNSVVYRGVTILEFTLSDIIEFFKMGTLVRG